MPNNGLSGFAAGARERTRAMIRAAGADVRKLEPPDRYECPHCKKVCAAASVDRIVEVPVEGAERVHVVLRDHLVICEDDGYAMKKVVSGE